MVRIVESTCEWQEHFEERWCGLGDRLIQLCCDDHIQTYKYLRLENVCTITQTPSQRHHVV